MLSFGQCILNLLCFLF